MLTNPELFEKERARLMDANIDSLPEEHRQRARDIQSIIDAKRVGLSPEKFLDYIIGELRENVVNLEDQLHALMVALETSTADKPRFDQVHNMRKDQFTDKS